MHHWPLTVVTDQNVTDRYRVYHAQREGMQLLAAISMAAEIGVIDLMGDPGLLKHRFAYRSLRKWLLVSCKVPKSIQRIAVGRGPPRM